MGKSEKKSKSSRQAASEARHASENLAGPGQPPAAVERLGAALKAARLDRGESLLQVSEQTRISHRHLQNLEEGRYADLPGGMYNRAFLKSYCVHLELDPAKFLERYERETEPQGEKTVKVKLPITPLPAGSRRIHPWLTWSAMLVVSVIGLYLSRGWIAEVFSPYFSPRPETAPPASTAAPPAAAPKSEETTAPPVSPAATATQEPAGMPAAAQTPRQPEVVPGMIRLRFNLVEPCWISLVGDGVRVPSRIYQPGEDVVFDATSRFEIVLGNAGGVKLSINGKPAKPLGEPGAVVRLSINAENIPSLLLKQS